jgi:recombination associated protein RdgC
MFKSASYFRIDSEFVLPPIDTLEEALQAARFVPCGATQADSSGWVPPRRKSVALAEYVGGHLILKLCTERRALPASAVKAALEERIEKYKQETGNERVGSKLKKEMKEEIVFELLPRAFTKRAHTMLWLDIANKFIVVDTASSGGADRIVTALVEVLTQTRASGAPFTVKPVRTNSSAAASMSHWLATREAPAGFTVDRDCELKTPDEQKSTVRYSRHTLEIEEVAQHIATGKVPTQLAMTWNDRVSFVLNESAQLKKLKLLDVVMDGVQEGGKDDDGFDTDVAILTGELTGLLPELLEALGGELDEGSAAALPGTPEPVLQAA